MMNGPTFVGACRWFRGGLVWIVVILGVGLSEAKATEEQKAEIMELLLGLRVIDLDQECGLFSAPDSDIYTSMMRIRLHQSKLPDQAKEMINDHDHGPVDCEGMDVIGLGRIAQSQIDLFKESVVKQLEAGGQAQLEAGGQAQQGESSFEKCDQGLAYARSNLDQYFAAFPAGNVKGYDGCWNTTVHPGWTIDFCLSSGGSGARFEIKRENPNITCSLTGSSRPREDGVFFGAFTDELKCSDGSRIEHVEGFCGPKQADGTASCIFSAFQCGNELYVDPSNGETVLSGDFVFRRK